MLFLILETDSLLWLQKLVRPDYALKVLKVYEHKSNSHLFGPL